MEVSSDHQDSCASTQQEQRQQVRKQGSMAKLLYVANLNHNGSRKISGVLLLIVLSIVIANSLAFLFVEYGLFGGCSSGWNDQILEEEEGYEAGILEDEDTSCPALGISNTVPTFKLSDTQFHVYLGFIIYITVMVSGIGMEVLVWLMFLQSKWSETRENYGRLSQFAFPLLAVTTVGLASAHSYVALPILVAFLWKFGFPEIILYTYAALYETKHSTMERITDLLNGLGTALHHNATVLYMSMVIVGVIPANRYVIEVTLPLLNAALVYYAQICKQDGIFCH